MIRVVVQEEVTQVTVQPGGANVNLTSDPVEVVVSQAGPQGPQGVPGDEGQASTEALEAHEASLTPHPAYDDAPSFVLLFENGMA